MVIHSYKNVLKGWLCGIAFSLVCVRVSRCLFFFTFLLVAFNLAQPHKLLVRGLIEFTTRRSTAPSFSSTSSKHSRSLWVRLTDFETYMSLKLWIASHCLPWDATFRVVSAKINYVAASISHRRAYMLIPRKLRLLMTESFLILGKSLIRNL